MRTWIDTAVERGMARYLRTCEVGGMPHEQAEAVRNMLTHAGDMAVFSLAVVEDMSRQGLSFHQNYHNPENEADGTKTPAPKAGGT